VEKATKWLSARNRSPRSSTPRRPITMASTDKPPDPMPCALAALLLPDSCARGYHMRKTLFPGSALAIMRGRACPGRACTRGTLVRRAWAAGAGTTAWVRGVGTWRRGWASSVVRVLLAARRAGEGGVRVGVRGTGRHGVFPQCWVGHVRSLGIVRRPVALSGLLLQWPSGALDC